MRLKPTPAERLLTGWIWLLVTCGFVYFKLDPAFVAGGFIIAYMNWMEAYE